MMYCNFQGSPHPAWPRNMGRLHLRLGQSPHLAAVTRSRLVRCRISGMPQQKPQSQGFCGSPQKLSQEGSEGYLPQMCVVNTKYPRRYSLNGVTRRAASPWSKYSNQWGYSAESWTLFIKVYRVNIYFSGGPPSKRIKTFKNHTQLRSLLVAWILALVPH